MCHVIVQGIEKEYIFNDKIFKEKYYNLIQENFKKFEIKVLAYVIMSNHVHLCLYYDDIKNLSKFMHTINSDFARYYNFVKTRVGYVFRNRYYTQEIRNQRHLFNTIAYIHNNPVKAGMVLDASQYLYSSFNDYINNCVDKEIILIVFNTTNYKLIFNQIHIKYESLEIADVVDEFQLTLEDVLNEFLQKNNVELEEIKSKNNLLLELILELKLKTRQTNKKIANLLGIDKNKMTRLYKKLMEKQ